MNRELHFFEHRLEENLYEEGRELALAQPHACHLVLHEALEVMLGEDAIEVGQRTAEKLRRRPAIRSYNAKGGDRFGKKVRHPPDSTPGRRREIKCKRPDLTCNHLVADRSLHGAASFHLRWTEYHHAALLPR